MTFAYIVVACLVWLVCMGVIYQDFVEDDDLFPVFLGTILSTATAIFWPLLAIIVAPFTVLYIIVVMLLFPFYGWFFRQVKLRAFLRVRP